MSLNKLIPLIFSVLFITQCGDKNNYTEAQKAEIIQEQPDSELEIE